MAGKLGLELAVVNESATAVWAPTGIALALLLILGQWVWPGIFLGAFLVNVTTTGIIATSLGIASGNTLEGLVGAWLVSRFANGCSAFERSQDIFKFAFLAGMVSTAIAATIGVTSLCLGGLADPRAYGAIWLTWWLGDAAGGLIAGPLVLLWWAHPRWTWGRFGTLEAALLLCSLLLVGLTVFGAAQDTGPKAYPLGFVCFPLLAWPAFRFGQRETVTSAFVLCGLAILGTLRGRGPFALEPPNDSLLLLQTFMGVITVTAAAMAAEVSERKRFASTLRHLADHDFLTGLLAPRRFLADLAHELARSRRYGDSGALVFLDLDNFKAVNDSLGHLRGDEVLKSVSVVLRRRLRDTDPIARLGGDEFAILLPRTDMRRGLRIADELRGTLAAHEIEAGGSPMRLTASVGIALYPEHGEEVEDLLARADTAMYRAKEQGRDRVCVFSEEAAPRTADSLVDSPCP